MITRKINSKWVLGIQRRKDNFEDPKRHVSKYYY